MIGPEEPEDGNDHPDPDPVEIDPGQSGPTFPDADVVDGGGRG